MTNDYLLADFLDLAERAAARAENVRNADSVAVRKVIDLCRNADAEGRLCRLIWTATNAAEYYRKGKAEGDSALCLLAYYARNRAVDDLCETLLGQANARGWGAVETFAEAIAAEVLAEPANA